MRRMAKSALSRWPGLLVRAADLTWSSSLLCLVCLAWLGLFATPAAANSELSARSYLVDPTGQLTIGQVKAAPKSDFESFDQALSLGYASDTVWLPVRPSPTQTMFLISTTGLLAR